jgi:phosphoribosylformylglycinamidine cyclo-ligase
VLPKGLGAAIETGSWQTPPLFGMLRKIGQVPEDDWRRTFNLGVGMIFVVPQAKLALAQRALKKTGEKPWVIGEIIKQRRGKAKVEYR